MKADDEVFEKFRKRRNQMTNKCVCVFEVCLELINRDSGKIIVKDRQKRKDGLAIVCVCYKWVEMRLIPDKV